jgi:preprotein translocase subunit SecB
VVELDYGGLFTVTGVPETHMRPLLMIECPRILFPFARRILADVTRDGGYPPLMLDLIDFANIYRQEIERRRMAADAPLA